MNIKGFTLIELVVVIVILGILAVTALPKFININEDAHRAVNSSIMASFDSAVNQSHLKWIVKGQPDSIIVDDIIILMSKEGYPNTSTGDNADCLEIWNNIIDTSVNIIENPSLTMPVEEWSAFGTIVGCLYISHNGESFSNTTPYFFYSPSTGVVLGVGID